MRVPEVAKVLGLSRQRVYEMISSGALPHTRVSSRSIRVPRLALEAWLEVHAERSIDALRLRPKEGSGS